VPSERLQPAVGERLHARSPRHVLQQRDLAEEVAGAELARRRPVHGHPEPSRFDHVEEVAWVALADHLFPGGDLDRLQLRGEPLDSRSRQRREDRDRLEQP
jgi:hypothetical protein